MKEYFAFQSFNLGRRATEELSIPFDKKYGAGNMDLLKKNMIGINSKFIILFFKK